MLRIATLLPDLLGTYGDGGNATVLVARARARGIACEVVEMRRNDAVPKASLYLMGGGEDGPQRLACEVLRASNFGERVRDGARVFAVCAGLQILGRHFSVEGDDEFEGLGLVDIATRRGTTRSVGDLCAKVDGRLMVGFENHGGVTTLGDGLVAFGDVVRGRGNDGVVDGFRTESLWATYAHGPVLAQNPWLADKILESALGETLEPFTSVADRLYEERCRELSPRSGFEDRRRDPH